MTLRTREEQREERRRYEGDVEYEVWRNGGNMDRVNRDRVEDAYHDGQSVESAAARELRSQRPRPACDDEQFPDEQFPEERFPSEPTQAILEGNEKK